MYENKRVRRCLLILRLIVCCALWSKKYNSSILGSIGLESKSFVKVCILLIQHYSSSYAKILKLSN